MIYLDASVVVPMFLVDAHTTRVLAWLASSPQAPVASPWTIAEFSSAAAGLQRMGQVDDAARLSAERSFDSWLADVEVVAILTSDFESARDMIRQGGAKLRTPDALHLSIARRGGFALATLDSAMAEAAHQMGIVTSTI